MRRTVEFGLWICLCQSPVTSGRRYPWEGFQDVR